jgi:TIR domain-containing protein
VPDQSPIQIFLSYTIKDRQRVLLVYDYLIKNGFPNVWMDCKKLLAGQTWEFEIFRNLKSSEIFLFFLSHHSVSKRRVVQKELNTALKFLEEKIDGDIYLIPKNLDSDVQVPEWMSR